MEMKQFDVFTRHLSGTGSSRRQMLRALGSVFFGSTFGSVAGLFSLDEEAEAKQKHKKAKSRQQTAKKRHGQLQVQGKSKKKHKKPKPHPDARCDPDVVKLCGTCEKVVCIDGDWVCSSNGERECPDGSCVAANACCGDKYRCDDGTCIDPFSECCPDQKLCASTCIAQDACCHLDPAPLCSPCERVVCEQGSWVCQARADVKACADGSCVPVEACCPETLPECGGCEHLECVDGHGVCKPITQECPGGEWDPALCRCKYCEETCDPVTHMCQSIGCPEGSHCEAGQCIQMCTNPSKPQLCCLDEAPGRADRCTCQGADVICYASGGISGCIPGQTCCPPDDVRAGVCPQACLEWDVCKY